MQASLKQIQAKLEEEEPEQRYSSPAPYQGNACRLTSNGKTTKKKALRNSHTTTAVRGARSQTRDTVGETLKRSMESRKKKHSYAHVKSKVNCH